MSTVPRMPSRASSFIGRKKEMAELRRQMAHTRLLTVLGPGGVGKTRLATEVARRQADHFADGSLLVELAEVRDGAMIPDAFARAAGITLQKEDTIGALSRRLTDRHLLLVVDNCEHLVAAVAPVVARLLKDCQRVSVLATSRERLNLDGETSWSLPPLMLPDSADGLGVAASTDAVRLFVDRARSVGPGFDLNARNLAPVIAICRKLEGIPLAIELAAARSATLSPDEIMARLDDRLRLLTGGSRDADVRHRTLRATLDWSYDLLEPAERALLQRLSVFAGAFRLDAAQEVCGFDPLDVDRVLDGLQGLSDKSMLQAERTDGQTRFRVLETVREYGAQKLAETGETNALRDRHLALYSRLAREASDARTKRGAMAEHKRLWAEMPDVREALDWVHPDLDAEVEFLGNLRHLWVIFAPAEGLRRLFGTLSGIDYKPTRGYVRALATELGLAGRSGRHDKALGTPELLADLAIKAGEEAFMAIRHFGVAYYAERVTRDLKTARQALEAAVAEFERVGNLPDTSMALASLGAIEMQEGNLEAAAPWIERALELALEIEDDYDAVGAFYTRGWLEVLSGDTEAAYGSFSAALGMVGDGDVLSVAQQAEGIAAAATATDARQAVTLFGAASSLRDEAESPASLPWSRWIEPAIVAALSALPKEIGDKAWNAGRAMSAPRVRDLALRRSGKGKRAAAPGGLSRRELEIAQLVAKGHTSKAIAERLFLSERTVESHLDHILGKLGVNSRAQVAAWVAEQSAAEGGAR
ncbi:MAG: LuxR C-terminal-related transcriptional regulator [Candidatus Dormibacter sp.]